MLKFLSVQIQCIVSWVMNFIFFGSKSIVSSRSKPYVCGVRPVLLDGTHGRVFYPSKRRLFAGPNVPWFTHHFPDIVKGKLQFFFPPATRSSLLDVLCRIVILISRVVPTAVLPRIPNTASEGEVIELPDGEESMPLIVWSHGNGGNVHDHALLMSEFAVAVPAIVVGITHTDGSADTWNDSRKNAAFFRHAVISGPVSDDRFLAGMVQMKEYQVTMRIAQIKAVIEHLKTDLGFKFGKVIVGGFDLGGATVVAMASRSPDGDTGSAVAGGISLDGTFALVDRIPFPASVFAHPTTVPTAFLLSDEWQVWNRVMTTNTKRLMDNAERPKLITVKQTKHYNFVESMYWVPQPLVFLLRLSGVIHRRGNPRKTYRRTVKWLTALVQQYVADGRTLRSASESEL